MYAIRSYYEQSKHFEGREGDVEEEADAGIGKPVADQLGEEEQLVVVDPDDVVGTSVLEDGVGEALVDAPVGGELVLVEDA